MSNDGSHKNKNMTEEKKHNYSLNIKLSYVTNFIFLVLSVIPALFLVNSALSTSSPEIYTNNLSEITQSLEVWKDIQLGTNGATNLWTLFPAGIAYLAVNAVVNLDGQILQMLYVTVFFFIGFKSAFSLFSKLFGRQHTFALFVASIFYMYNIIVARLVGGAYPFLMSYAFIPLFLSYFIGYTQEKRKRDIAISALALAMVFGPNLVFGFVALFAAGLYVVYGMIVENMKFIKNLIPLFISFFLSVLLIAWWFLPSFLLTRVAADDVSTVINSEDFYNLDTGPTNILRSLGDWAFFSGHQGTPYVHYASSFLKNPLVIFGGFLPFLALIWALTRKNIRVNKQIIFAALLTIPTLFIIGGTHKEWVTSGIMRFAFDNVSGLLIFRNTHKFSVLIIIAFCIAIYLAIVRLQTKPYPKVISYAFLLLLFLPAFPLYLNTSASDGSLIDAFPSYWEKSAETLNSQNVQKALLLPDQYFSVFNWNGETKSLGGGFEAALYDFPVVQNTCVGCAIQRSQDLIEQMTVGFEEPNYAKLLQIAGISHIIQRNDYDAGFYGVKNAKAIDTILATRDNINEQEKFGELTVYQVDSAYPNIYSPTEMVINNSGEPFSLLDNLDTSKQVAVIDSNDVKPSLTEVATTSYDSLFHDITKVKVSEKSVEDSFASAIDEEQNLSVKLSNPIFALNNPDSNINITSSESRAQSMPTPGITFDAATARPEDYVLTESMIDPTVFSGVPDGPAGNCRPSETGAILNKSKLTEPGYEGIELSADKDLACITIKPRKIELNNNYLMWFDYKIVDGNYFGYCMSFDGATCKKKELLVGEKGQWKRHYVEFSTKNNAQLGASTLFLYAPGFTDGVHSTVQYANIEGYLIDKSPEVYLQKDETFKKATYDYPYETIDYEVVPDAEMTGSDWQLNPSSCSLVLDTSYFNTEQLNIGGDDVIQLESRDTLACTNGGTFPVENDATYVLEIKNRVLEGKEYGYCILVGSECLIRNQVKTDSSDWRTDRFLVNLKNQTNGEVRFYLYGSDSDPVSKVQFSKISLKQLKSYDIPRFGVSSSTEQKLTQLNITKSSKTGRSRYGVEGTAEPGSHSVLAFLQSYSTAWSLYVNGVEISQDQHIPLNYFANGWLIDVDSICSGGRCSKDAEGNYIINADIMYKPQQILKPSIMISAASYVLVGGFAVVDPKAIRRYSSRLKRGKSNG